MNLELQPEKQGEGGIQRGCFGSPRWGQAGWPECKDFQTFCCGNGKREESKEDVLAAWGGASMNSQNTSK